MNLRLRATPIAAGLGLVAAILGLAALAIRTGYAVSFSEPLHLYTSGTEHGPLFVLWRVIEGGQVYLDPHKIPFAPTHYNWLYFALYGQIAKAVLALLDLPMAWLPTIVRLATLVFSLAGGWVFYRLLLCTGRPGSRGLRLVAGIFAIWMFTGPLAGFWTITAHPEMSGAVLLALSLYLFCRFYPDHRLGAILLFVAVSYAAWGMKQLYVYGPGAVGFYLLLHRDWKALALLCVALPGLWGLTFLVANEEYLKVILFKDTFVSFSASVFLRNAGNAAAKMLPVILGLAGVLYATLRDASYRQALFRDHQVQLFFLGLVVSLVISVPTSAKIGAAENYFIPVAMFATALLFTAICIAADRGVAFNSPIHGMIAIGWVASIVAVILLLTGVMGVLSTRYYHNQILAYKACLDPLPKPIFSINHYNMLPWMQTGSPPFVLMYEYNQDRAAGRTFEAGGIGGLIEKGSFAALHVEADARGTFDGALLTGRYRLLDNKCGGISVWLRKDLAVPPK